jgi:hypothetical protein
MQNGGEMAFYQNGLDFKPKSISKNGSIIKDDRGQWAYPGEVTEIGSNDITMQGVDYPVLGVSDTGDTQMMYPDQDYKFDGEKVTEYPMAQNGDWLSKYDNISNTNSLKKEAEERLSTMGKPKSTISQYTPKPGEQAKFDKQKLDRIAEDNAPLNRMAASQGAENMQDAIEAALIMEGGMFAGKLIGKGAKAAGKYLTEETALKNAYKLNPYAFKPTEGMMYRGIGKEGMEDALQSGLFRAKQDVTPTSIGNFNTTRQFSKAYYSPRFDIADQYGQGFIAEVPKEASGWGKRYGTKEWSQIAQRDIPTTEGKVLQKDWLKRYKEVPKPKSSVDNVGAELESKISKLKQQEVLAEESRKNLWANYKAGKITGEEYTIGAKKLNPTPFDNPRYTLEKQLREHKVKQEIVNTPQQNILKSEEQLGKNISDGGTNNKGVFELGDDHVARLSTHRYDDASRLVNYADKIKSPRIAKTVQVKEIDGKVYQVQEKVQGTPITKLSKEDYNNIPKQHIDNFWKDKSELDKLGLSIDISGGKSNVFYDTKKGFQFIDLGIGKNESNKIISETLKLPKSNGGWLDKYK